MNEDRIRQVLEIEKQAQEIQDTAKRDAQEVPMRAEQDAQVLIAKAVAEAHEEARKLVAEAQAKGVSAQVAEDETSRSGEFEASAKKNFDKAVAFVLDRVIGKA